jgi:hypothetical protein
MFLTLKKKRLIKHIQTLAEKHHYAMTELNPGSSHNVVCIQPYDVTSQVGPTKELVTRFNRLIRQHIAPNIKKGVQFCPKSKKSGTSPDFTESEPDFATPEDIYFIELRFT